MSGSARYRERGMRPLSFGAITIVLVLIGCYFAYTKSVPFRPHYEIQAVFKNGNLLSTRAPVRIAGVDVGKVVKVERYKDTNLALVTMQIETRGRPIHKDATLKIRPRLFLEGNFYVDMQPGRPDSPQLADEDMIPLAQTATPVQIDQLLDALQADTRSSLQQTLQGFGDALSAKPTAAEDSVQDAYVQGLTGAQGLNKSLVTAPDALRGTAISFDGLQGQSPRTISRLIDSATRTMTALADQQANLTDLVSTFNTTMATTAQRSADISALVDLLGPTAVTARRAFASLARAMPVTERFVTAFTPAWKELPSVVAAGDPWLDQAGPLLSQAELGGLLDALVPTTTSLARLTAAQREFIPVIDRFTRCMNDVFLPTGDVKVSDGPLSAGAESYKEFFYAMVGLAGQGQSFDGNGPMLRLQAAGGDKGVTTGKTNYQQQPLFAKVALAPLRTRPAFPNKVPPLRRDVPCYTQPIPNVNGPASTGPADGSRPNGSAPASPGPPQIVGASASGASAVPLVGARPGSGR
jgi:phospholipid/cholesterol/gamma-HCH transport system substrate-binding protein